MPAQHHDSKQNPRYAKAAGCSGCVLERAGFGFVLPSGPSSARLQFVGESAGWEEALKGEPFYGAAGGTLSRLCMRAGIRREGVRIFNTVSCRPPGDYLVGASYEEAAVNQCRQYVMPELAAVPTDGVVVPLGGTALDTVLGLRGVAGVQVKDFHGTVTEMSGPNGRYWVVPTFHPSHLQRGAMNLLEVVTQDLALADRISQRGFTRSAYELVVDPHPDWFRTWCAGYLDAVRLDPDGCHLSLDTEFAEKAGGADESEVVGSSNSPITRINGGRDTILGWTVPYREPYISIFEDLLRGVAAVQGWVWLWNKYADLDHLRAAGHTLTGSQFVDAMWLWHYLQSDLPRGLGFVAALASDLGAWKHWAKDPAREGLYAAADGLQTWRTSMWLLKAAHRERLWDIFLTDWHERDLYVLRPAMEQGVPVNRVALEAFHAELQVKLGSVLERIKLTAAAGTMKPKLGYARKPTCKACGGRGYVDEGEGLDATHCAACNHTGVAQPPASILGKPKKGGGEAKSQYILEGVRLVERTVDIDVNACDTCGAVEVGAKHKCKQPPRPKRAKRGAAAPAELHVVAVRSLPVLVRRTISVQRYFWQLPFNPDAPAQVLAYLAQQGIAAPTDKKTGKATTNKKALSDLQKSHRDDPFFQLQMDWKAVQKVDSTYAVGALTRLDKDDRLHPEFLPKPSTFRDSCVGVNLQNVVADKSGPEGLASGFRKCIVARDGVPPGVTVEDLAAWETRWLVPNA